MFEQLHKTLASKIELSDDEFALVKTFFKPKKLMKKQ
jgi:hypothetical protein